MYVVVFVLNISIFQKKQNLSGVNVCLFFNTLDYSLVAYVHRFKIQIQMYFL